MPIPRYLDFARMYPVTTAALGTGITSGVETGRGILQSAAQVQQMRQSGALAPFQRKLMAAQVQQIPYKTQLLEAQAQLAQTQAGAAPFKQQLLKAQAQQMPYKTQLLQAQTDALVAKTQQGMAPLSPMGKMVSDYNNAVKRGDMAGTKNIQNSIDVAFAKQRQQLLTPGEKAYETKASKDFVTASGKAAQDSDLGSQIIDQTRSFQKAYNDIPSVAKGFAYNKYISPKVAWGMGKLGSYQTAQKASSWLIQNALKQLHSGRMLTKLIELVNQGSLTMGTNPPAVKNIAELLTMTGKLLQEKSKFYGALRNAGVIDATEAASLWSQYRSKYPLVSSDLKTNLSENLTKWQEFIPGAKKATSKENDPLGLR